MTDEVSVKAGGLSRHLRARRASAQTRQRTSDGSMRNRPVRTQRNTPERSQARPVRTERTPRPSQSVRRYTQARTESNRSAEQSGRVTQRETRLSRERKERTKAHSSKLGRWGHAVSKTPRHERTKPKPKRDLRNTELKKREAWIKKRNEFFGFNRHNRL